MPSVLKSLKFYNFAQEGNIYIHLPTYQLYHYNAIAIHAGNVYLVSFFGDAILDVTDVLHKMHNIDMRTEVT